MSPKLQDLYAVVEETWPPANKSTNGCWTIRDGQGGGKRASAATALGIPEDADIPVAEAAMAALGQVPLFMIRTNDQALDAMLAARGYGLIDPVTMYRCPIDTLTVNRPPRLSAFEIWPPLAIEEEIWAKGGIGASRVAVMHRIAGAKTTLLARSSERAAAVAFVALHGDIAMLHALEVLPDHRRKGVAVNMIRAAAYWAKAQGARHFSVVTTRENLPANRLYTSLNMKLVGEYHYRIQSPIKAALD